MNLVHLVALLAIAQYIFFAVSVGVARGKYGVPVPAMTGNELFERAVRVHMNTLEQLVAFLPAMLIAAQYWPPQWIAGLGAVYLVGRLLYWRSYIADPAKRGPGFLLTFLPTVLFVGLGLTGAIRQFFVN